MFNKVDRAQKAIARSWIYFKSKKEYYKCLLMIKPDLNSDFAKRLREQDNQEPLSQAIQENKKVESDLKKAKKLWKYNEDYLHNSI